MNCGEGTPDFYAKEITSKNGYCINKLADKFFAPFYNHFGLCESIDHYNFRKDSNGDPLITECQTKNFAMYYATKESFNLWEALYANTDGLQDKFIAYWDHTSKRFAKNPYVVGYDPLNEPLMGNPLANLGLVKPGEADKDHLAPLYSKIYEKY